MSKKRNRQPDANCDRSDGSTDSCDETGADSKCPHIAKSVNLSRVKKKIKSTGIAAECVACKKEQDASEGGEREKHGGTGALWICLQCGNQGCGRERRKHAIEHFKKPHSDCHNLVADTRHWNVWCYLCESELNHVSKKKLKKTVEFVKRLSSAPISPQTPMAATFESRVELQKAEKESDGSPSSLPKVGGLANLGNTCFFNAVLQCLAQTPYLVKVLNDQRNPGETFVLPGGKHKPSNSEEEADLPPIEETLECWGRFTSILCKTLVDMQTGAGGQTYSPRELLSAFRKKTTQCVDGRQHDAHELLRHLLELVRNEDLRRYRSVILKKVGLNGKTNPDDVEEGLKSRVKFYGNQASSRLLGTEPVFRGVLVSVLECLDCHHSSQSTEPFLDLSLPVVPDKPQPPVLKRKSNGHEESFDMTGNSIPHVPTKHQLKKQKNAARKNRRNRLWKDNEEESREENHEGTLNQSNAIGENDLQSEESDADVEDNIEAEPWRGEVAESGYSSEKASALGSPVAPGTTAASGDIPAADTADSSKFLQACDPEISSSLVEFPQVLNGESDESNESELQELYKKLNREAKKVQSPHESIECNGLRGLASGISRISISQKEMPSRYQTKEGECSIQSCLNQFTALELMSGSNKVGCEACTARERKTKENCKMVCSPSTKQYLIARVPAVLILHLKRFLAQGIDFRKLTKHVVLPTLLDLAPVCKSRKRPRVYALYGVVEQRGTIHGGHYVAYVKKEEELDSSLDFTKKVTCELAKCLIIQIHAIYDLIVRFLLALYYDRNIKKIPRAKNELLLDSAVQLAEKIRKRKIKSEEVVHAFIERAKEVNPKINAVVQDRYEEAIAEACRVDALIAKTDNLEYLAKEKPFLGVPFTTKESNRVKGMRHTMGTKSRSNTVSSRDATCVSNVKNAGGILIATTNVPELNLWSETRNLIYGETKNPYNLGRTVGGSSGGEGAIITACGSAISISSDIGGSTRMPAFYCGVYGFKSTEGPLCKRAEDLPPLLKVLIGEKSSLLKLDAPVDVSKLRIFYQENCGDLRVSKVCESMSSALLRAIRHFGEVTGSSTKIRVPGTEHTMKLWKFWMTQENFDFKTAITNGKYRTSALMEVTKLLSGKSEISGAAIMKILDEDYLPKVDADWAKRVTNTMKKYLTDKLGEDGVLLYPSAPYPAQHHYFAYFNPYNFGYWALFNVLRLPCCQIPMGLDDEGLPVGIQVVAAPHQDHLCIAVAKELERAFGGWVPPS